MKTKCKNMPIITLKQAEQLAYMELGTTKGLERDLSFTATDTYKITMGTMIARISPDFLGSGCIELSVFASHGVIRRYYDPDTLKENEVVEKKQLERYEKEEIENHIYEIGLEQCQKIINRKSKKRRKLHEVEIRKSRIVYRRKSKTSRIRYPFRKRNHNRD